MGRATRLMVAALVACAAAMPAGAQEHQQRDTTARTSLAADALWFGLGTAAVAADDAGWQRSIQGYRPQSSSALGDVARIGNAWGSPGAIALAGGIWAVGYATHDSAWAVRGLRILEAMAVSGTITGGIKGIAGRARPFASPGHPDDWQLGRGIREDRYQSFPSGHSTAAFAFAAALSAELDEERSPLAPWAVRVLYPLAVVTALSRTYANDHWLSDVATGAGVGTLSGLFVVRWHARHGKSWLDRLIPGP